MAKRETKIISENYCNNCGEFCQYEAYKIHLLDSDSCRYFCSHCSEVNAGSSDILFRSSKSTKGGIMQTASIGALEIGAIKNYLKILSDDQKGFHPEVLRKVTGLPVQSLAKKTGVSRQRMYSEIVRFKPDSELMKKIIQVVIATDEIYELMNNNEADTALWLGSPNAVFMGYSPFEVCLQGRGEEVINWVRTRLGKIPGSGF